MLTRQGVKKMWSSRNLNKHFFTHFRTEAMRKYYEALEQTIVVYILYKYRKTKPKWSSGVNFA